MDLNTKSPQEIYQRLVSYDYETGIETNDNWDLAGYLSDIYNRLEKLEKDNELSAE